MSDDLRWLDDIIWIARDIKTDSEELLAERLADLGAWMVAHGLGARVPTVLL